MEQLNGITEMINSYTDQLERFQRCMYYGGIWLCYRPDFIPEGKRRAAKRPLSYHTVRPFYVYSNNRDFVFVCVCHEYAESSLIPRVSQFPGRTVEFLGRTGNHAV